MDKTILKAVLDYDFSNLNKIIDTWHFKDKHRDLDNCVPKNILDALVNIGILKNDNLTCIREIQHKSIVDGNYYVELEIEEYEE